MKKLIWIKLGEPISDHAVLVKTEWRVTKEEYDDQSWALGPNITREEFALYEVREKEGVMFSRKRVWIDFTYYEKGNPSPIAASFRKTDPDEITYVRESDAKKEVDSWRKSSESWKKAFNDLTESIRKKSK